MRKTSLFFVGYLLLYSIDVTAQTNHCLVNVDMQWLQTNAPARYQRFVDLENFTANYINGQGQPNARLINNNGLIIIPVVVHVLYNVASQNISDDRITSQINVLNADFRRLNADAINTPSHFLPYASDMGIEFRLACLDPNGNSTTGIVRKQTPVQLFTGFQNERADGTLDDENIGWKSNPNGSPAWDTERYLNIWVCPFDVPGYSTSPADFSTYPQYDGVVIQTQAFGVGNGAVFPTNLGRTATHEIGHWLNLKHLWSDNRNGNTDCLYDDDVGDTPQQKRPTSPDASTCPTNFPYADDLCNLSDHSAMYMNYMDYVNDACYNMFSIGQKARTRALFASGGVLTREPLLNNWFKVRQKITPIRCTGTIYSNVMCLPTTWTILSGPAIISSGQGTSQATIQATGVGTVFVRAVSGNYISEENIEVTTVPPTVTGIYQVMSNYHNGSWSTLGPNNQFFLPANQIAQLSLSLNSNIEISSLNWTNTGGYQVQIYPANNGYFLNWVMQAGSTPYAVRTTTNNLTYQSSCGTTTSSFNFTVITSGWYRIMTTPNPSKGNLNLIVKNLISNNSGLSFNQTMTVDLLEVNTGTKVKSWKLKHNQEIYNLNTRGIRTGQYLLTVTIGKYTQTQHVQIEN